jgi:hypothetical protein
LLASAYPVSTFDAYRWEQLLEYGFRAENYL